MSLINVDWDFALLEEFIQARGDNVVIETGVACTCRNNDLYASTILRHNSPASFRRMNCERCQGDGFIFRNARIVKGLITGIDPGKNRSLIDSGYAMSGDMVFSPSLSQGHLIGDFDKLTFSFPEEISDGQVIMRGAAHLEDNALVPTDLTTSQDRLWYVADCAIWCEDEDGIVYKQDADFTLSDKKITWIGKQPAEGKLYVLKYMGYPEWIIYTQPFIRYDRNRSLGKRVLLRRKHVHFNTGSQAATPEARQQEEVTLTTDI